MNINELVTIEAEATDSIIIPTYSSLIIPGKPDYMDTGRANVNSFGTTDISKFNGTTEELIHEIGADFKAVKRPTFRQTGEFVTLYDASGNPMIVPGYEEVNNNYLCVNDKTGAILGTGLTDRYEIFDFDEGIYFYMGILDEIAQRGYEVSPAYAKLIGGGTKLFIQHKILGGNLMGEPVDTYLALITSHDKSAGFTLALSTVRLFCQNQINRMLRGATSKVTLRHTRNNQTRIQAEATRMIKLEESNRIALAEYAESLANVRVSNQQIFDALAAVSGLQTMKTQRQVNNFQNRAEQLFACYEMPDVNDWRGTALGAYYAMSDMMQHVKPLRTPSNADRQAIRDFNVIESGLEGNLELGQFADTLVEIAK